jgi:GT2 family glycosyltransferase
VPWDVGSGNNFAVRRDAFLRIGGNDERLGPGSAGKGGVDMDLFYRLVRGGGCARFEPLALVLHERASPRDRLARRIPYGYGLGASATILWREGDPRGLRLLMRWIRFRLAIALRSAIRLRYGGIREEALILVGTIRGIAYGNRAAKPIRRA